MGGRVGHDGVLGLRAGLRFDLCLTQCPAPPLVRRSAEGGGRRGGAAHHWTLGSEASASALFSLFVPLCCRSVFFFSGLAGEPFLPPSHDIFRVMFFFFVYLFIL
jgi:hypothetical protein